MRRRLLLIIALLALLAAACGSDRSTAFDLATEDAASGAQLSAGAERVLAAVETSSAMADVSIVMTAEAGGLPQFDGEAVLFEMEAAIAGDGSRGRLMFDFGSVMASASAEDLAGLGAAVEMFSEPIEMRFVDDTVYVSSGFVGWLLPIDTPWVAFSAEAGGAGDSIGFSMDTFSVSELMMVLRGLDAEPEVVGTELVDGVETSHVRGQFSAARLAELGGEFDLADFDFGDFSPSGLGGLDVDLMDVDVWIDEDDFVRRLRFGVDDLAELDAATPAGAFFAFTIDFNDIGQPVSVDAPPASDVTVLDNLFG